ncbi:MAG: peptidoglycan bridge formation glycyltransferase FemA/FemB family protein [Spirochaetales bacterium]|nr:peptidoglycan bridge formation glycyltransferase FemA/FemB family protein [Spirochaetales bacterium]
MECVEVINPLQYTGWNDLVRSHPDYTFFHSTYWLEVLNHSYHYKPFFFIFKKNDMIRGIVPVLEVRNIVGKKNGISLPFSDYCPPLVFSDTSDLEKMIYHILSYAKKTGWQYIELRDVIKEVALQYEGHRQIYYHHIVDLDDSFANIVSRYKSCNRRNIVKAEKCGVKIDYHTNLNGLKAYYRLHCKTRKKHGVPPQPFSFFRNIWKHVLKNGKGVVALASHEENIIAGAVFFHFGKKVLYKYGASDTKFNHLRPNNCIMCDAIKKYHEKGYASMSFGRTSPDNRGLLSFKGQWGAEIMEMNYLTVDVRKKAGEPIHYGSKRLARYMKLIPVSLLRVIGRFMYRYMG